MGRLIAKLMRDQQQPVEIVAYSKKDKVQIAKLLALVKEFQLSEERDASEPERLIAQGFTLLAKVGSDYVGFLNYKKFRNDYWHICALGVNAAARGKGLGRALLEFLITKALASSPKAIIMIGVNPQNKVARSLYIRVGFEVVESGVECDTPFELMRYRNRN